MFNPVERLFRTGDDSVFSEELSRCIRLCNLAAMLLVLNIIPLLAVYLMTGFEVLIALSSLVIVTQWGVLQLNRLGFHQTGRFGFIFVNGLLIYLGSCALGEDTGVSLFYMAAVIAPYIVFHTSEVILRTFSLVWILVLIIVDLLLQARLLADLVAGPEDQKLLRWFLVPAAILAISMFLLTLQRESSRKEQETRKLRSRFSALLSASDDLLLEVNPQLQVLGLWNGEGDGASLSVELYRTRSLQDWLPAERLSLLQDAVQDVIRGEPSRQIDYQCPFEGSRYAAKLVPSCQQPGEDARVLVLLRNVERERSVQQRLLISDQIIHNNHDAILVLDAGGLIQSCNRSAEQLYGYSEADLKGVSIFLLRTAEGVSLQEVEDSLQDQAGWSGESRHRRRDGSLFDVQFSITVIRDQEANIQGYVMICRDVSAAKGAENQLRLSERRFKSMAEHVPGVVYEWYTRNDGTAAGFNYISPRAQDIFGRDPEKLMKDMRLLLQHIHPEDRAPLMQSIRDATVARSRWKHQFRIILDEQDVRWMLGVSAPIDWDDEVVVFHGILMDVTAEHRYREELMAAKERAEEASQAKAEFLSIMSHEIRTPMNAIIGLTHLLLSENPRVEQVENLSTLRFSAENLLSLINDILDFSKIEAGKIQLERVEFDLRDLLHGVCRTAQYSGQEKGLELCESIDSLVPRWVVGDPTRLAQILGNLLSNAVKFTQQGRVELSVMRLDSEEMDRALLEFRVTDSGIGIPGDKLERIFEYFTQADESITRSYGGTGLGLAITRALVEIFGSEIRVESEPGVGSSFYFRLALPYRRSPLEEPRYLLPLLDPGSLQGRRILLVEDNPVNVMVAEKLLRKWGAEVETAGDGYKAIELVERYPYDLVLMDIQMPLMDGYAATRKIRTLHDRKFARLPIIALSAATTDDVQAAAERAGMDGFLTKPINPGELRRKILRYLQSAEGQSA